MYTQQSNGKVPFSLSLSLCPPLSLYIYLSWRETKCSRYHCVSHRYSQQTSTRQQCLKEIVCADKKIFWKAKQFKQHKRLRLDCNPNTETTERKKKIQSNKICNRISASMHLYRIFACSPTIERQQPPHASHSKCSLCETGKSGILLPSPCRQHRQPKTRVAFCVDSTTKSYFFMRKLIASVRKFYLLHTSNVRTIDDTDTDHTRQTFYYVLSPLRMKPFPSDDICNILFSQMLLR